MSVPTTVHTMTAAALVTAATALAAPAQADTANDLFLAALDKAGIHYDNAAVAAQLGKTICPLLVQPGKDFASTAASVRGNGIPPAMAALFAGIAIKTYCPSMLSSMFMAGPNASFANLFNAMGNWGT